MTVRELLELIKTAHVPMDAKIAFWGYGDGSFFQVTDDVVYDIQSNQLQIGY